MTPLQTIIQHKFHAILFHGFVFGLSVLINISFKEMYVPTWSERKFSFIDE